MHFWNNIGMWKVFCALAILIFLAVVSFYKNPSGKSQSDSISENTKDIPKMEVFAKGLEVPWAIAFLPASPAGGPNGNLLVTERVGRLKILDKNGIVLQTLKIEGVLQNGESGLHGIAIHPKFESNRFIYLYYTYSAGGSNSLNRVSRFNFSENTLTDEKIIANKIPGAFIHDGGRIKFGPDGYLYITTGDASNPSLAQDKNSLAGKILRVDEDGKVEIFSYGHRNPQGIAWDSSGRLWETEHGQSATDEVNLIEQDKNYGWPIIRGDQQQIGMETPKIQSGTNTWAPAGLAFYNGSLFFGGLRGQTLFEVNIQTLYLKEHFKGQFGRIRDVVLGPDKMLYITTSNRDGRGNPNTDDDKIIKINTEKL